MLCSVCGLFSSVWRRPTADLTTSAVIRSIQPSEFQPPDTLSVTTAAAQFNIAFLPKVDAAAYLRSRSFQSWARKIGYAGTWVQYRPDCVNAIRDLIIAPIAHSSQRREHGGAPVGICLRALNDNDNTEQLLVDLNLPPHLIEVVRFYGAMTATTASFGNAMR